MEATDSPATIVSASMSRVRSAVKQKGEIRNLSQMFRNSG